MVNGTDTIAALATPPAAAARAVVRMSGSRAIEIAERVSESAFGAADFTSGPRADRVGLALGDGVVISAMRLCFFSPRSSTGEEVVEFHLPGSPFLVSRLLKRLFALGARQAEPGEFTARAFFHGKLDLAAAEGVVATIAASNRAELDAARQLLAGELARRLKPTMEAIASTLALIEVGIDFTDEDVTFIAAADAIAAMGRAAEELKTLLATSNRFDRIVHEPRIILAGRPNAGKSTLLNALAQSERAVVSDVAGTTRDVLSAPIRLRRGRAILIDAAGLDQEGADRGTDASIARQMREAALRAIESAEVVIRVIDSTDPRDPIALPRDPHLTVRTKADRSADPRAVSAVTGAGLDRLRDALDALAFPASPTEQGGTLALNARHVNEVQAARDALCRAPAALTAGPEFAAFELRTALDHLGRVLGVVSADDVLGRIFSSFCIGK